MFTAVDSTLLDAVTFEPGRSREMVQQLDSLGIPVVPVSVMTFEEIEPIANEVGIRHTMIVEAGGAIARLIDGQWELEACGPPADTVLDVVRAVEERSGADLLVYSAMPEEEASRLSGRTGAMLEHSTHRHFSEPFLIEHGDESKVAAAAESLGFKIRRGRRFLHLCRAFDEGEAFLRVREEMHCDVAIALGGSPVDAEFLNRSEVPIIIPGPDGSPDPELLGKVPQARIAPEPGPVGWAAAVEAVLPELATLRTRAKGA